MAEFKNPNQQGGGDNKSLLVMMLVLVTVFFGLQYFKAKSNPQTVSPNAATSAPQTPSQSAAPSSQPAPPTTASTPVAAKASGVPAVQASSEVHDHRRERTLQHHLHEPRRPGHQLDPQKIQGHRRQAPQPCSHPGGRAVRLSPSLFTPTTPLSPPPQQSSLRPVGHWHSRRACIAHLQLL